tara:strand:- start:634 stop:867 length:234 start_codon:yes stop_codon:yes gene_type:complete
LLGNVYKDKFEIGQYVEWRRIRRNENYEESVVVYQGIIASILAVDVGSRDVWYAKVIRNGGLEEMVLLSKIRKIETN